MPLQWLELTFPSSYRKQTEARTWTTSFRTLSYRKLPEWKTEMVKPAENETSKQPQSWAEAAKAAGVSVLTSQEQFDEGRKCDF